MAARQEQERQRKEAQAAAKVAEEREKSITAAKKEAEKATAALKAKNVAEKRAAQAASAAAKAASAAAAKAAAEAAAKPAWGAASSPATGSGKGRQSRGPSLADIQAEEQARAKQRQQERPSATGGRGTTMAERLAAANGGNSTGGWNGSGSKADKQTAQLKTLLGVETPPQFGHQQNKTDVGSNRNSNNPAKAKKSLLQIQNEEVIAQAAREQAAAVGRATGGGPKAGSWGAVAASGAGQQRLAPAASIMRQQQQQPPKQQLKASPIQTRKQQPSGDNALWDYQENNSSDVPTSMQTRTQPAAKPQARTARAASANAKDFGGAELPPGMSKWASGELQKLKGDRDLTLVHFCMTLQASADIREYMREFLGSTPEVSSFASEFIKRKRAAKKSKKGGKR